MENVLKNKVVVVTGGAEGIGYEIAKNFLEQQAKAVVVLDNNDVKGKEAIDKLNSNGNGRAVYIKCDVMKDLEEVSKKIFDTFGQVDVLINNAGTVDETSARKTLELNSIALVEWTMKFWEHMRKDMGGNGGTIINIGSISSYTMNPYLVFYKASKFAVLGFTRSLGHEDNFREFGVRLLAICPGFTHTSMTDKILCWNVHLKDFQEYIKTQLWQSADEVGKATVSVFQAGGSGTSWKIVGGKLEEVLFSHN